MSSLFRTKWPIKQILIIDLMAVGFGFLYYFIVNILGDKISIASAAFAAVIYWILTIVVYGLMGKLKLDD